MKKNKKDKKTNRVERKIERFTEKYALRNLEYMYTLVYILVFVLLLMGIVVTFLGYFEYKILAELMAGSEQMSTIRIPLTDFMDGVFEMR
ncbi:MAG: hypothetical protein K5673_00880 [Lachnospiraceae bacterium]|nr:hypothetical protein [Lachnospiraceae bacterium]